MHSVLRMHIFWGGEMMGRAASAMIRDGTRFDSRHDRDTELDRRI